MNLHNQLLKELEETFGPRSPNTSRFGSTSLGEIADHLSLSNSLITKLISGTATEGMYERCILNIKRVKEAIELRNQHLALEKEIHLAKKKRRSWIFATFLISILGLIGLTFSNFGSRSNTLNAETGLETKSMQLSQNEFLEPFFNPAFNIPHFLPYVPHDKVQDYCPCSAFEGDWELDKPYTIPIPFNKSGLYYVARSSDIKLKCVTSTLEQASKGMSIHGFESMKHELWMDSKHESLAPRFFDPEKKQFTEEFHNIPFQEDDRFEKVADLTSFFYNRFYFNEDSIKRRGEPSGRYASYINEEAIAKYEIDIKDILNHIVGNMIEVKCADIPNPYCDPNDLIEGESVIDFKCSFSINTENLGIGGTYPYTKGFKLIKQNYSNNLLCNCQNNI